LKEIIIFFIILLVLSLLQHPDFFTAPVDRIVELPTSGAYGIGAIHPLVFSVVAYLLFVMARGIGRGIKRIFIR